MGDSVEFCFNLNNYNTEKRTIRLEYGIYYRKMNGEMTRKVYKISEKEYKGNSITEVNRKHSFRPITTRTFIPAFIRLLLYSMDVNRENVNLNLLNDSFNS